MPYNNSASRGTVFEDETGEIIYPQKIYWINDFISVYECIVENIAISVLVHEWFSHGIRHYDDVSKTHRFAYENVINYKDLWEQTTDRYKGFIMKMLQEYTENETGCKSVGVLYQNLYNRYIKYYKNNKKNEN